MAASDTYRLIRKEICRSEVKPINGIVKEISNSTYFISEAIFNLNTLFSPVPFMGPWMVVSFVEPRCPWMVLPVYGWAATTNGSQHCHHSPRCVWAWMALSSTHSMTGVDSNLRRSAIWMRERVSSSNGKNQRFSQLLNSLYKQYLYSFR